MLFLELALNCEYKEAFVLNEEENAIRYEKTGKGKNEEVTLCEKPEEEEGNIDEE